MDKTEVVALGELLIDFTDSGKSVSGNPIYEANPGGAPCNVLSMLSNLGVKTEFIGKVGNDAFGNQLKDSLIKAGIGMKGLVTDEKVGTTLAFVHTLSGGDRDFSFYRNPGADMMLAADEVDESAIKECSIFHFGSLSMTSPVCEEATRKAISVALENEKFISFDPNLREPLWESLDIAKEKIAFGLSVCNMLKISDNEILWFTGEEDYDKAISDIQDKYPDIELILLTLGKDGSIAATKNRRVMVPGFVQEMTIETTGAGDTFCGCIINTVLKYIKAGMVLADLPEAELCDMLTFANAAASIITTRKGALMVMPKKEEIDSFIMTTDCAL